jgi:hypothetical protein
MQTNRSIEPPDSAVAAYDRLATEPAPSETSDPTGLPDGRRRARGPFARLLSVVRGDKYMADAYEPAWSALMARRAGARVLREGHDGELAEADRSAVESQPIDAGHAAPAASTQKER